MFNNKIYSPITLQRRGDQEPELKNPAVKELCVALAGLRSPAIAIKFLRDLCTLAEMKEMAIRWQIVCYLQDGFSYLEIAKKTGASTATITRVAQWLHRGTGGYKLMIERLGIKHRPRATH